MKTKRTPFFLRKIPFILALLFLSGSILIIGQSVFAKAKDKPACPKIDKTKVRKDAKKLKVQRSNKAPSVSKYSYEHGETIPNYM